MTEITYFSTSKGERIRVQSFPHMLPGKVQVAAEKKALELYPATMPTYDEPLMGGGVQTFEHDDKSVEGNPEAKAALDLYRSQLQKRTGYINEKMMQFYVLTGTVVELPENDRWLRRQRFFGIEIPDDEDALLYHYITTELLGDARELMALVEQIMIASGIDSDSLAAARVSFRSIVGEKEDTVGGPDEPDGGSGETSALVHVPTVPSFSGDGEVEDYSFAMG